MAGGGAHCGAFRRLGHLPSGSGARLHFPALATVARRSLALPLVAFLPFIGPGTALSFGISVGAGVLAGSRDVRGRLSGY